VDCELSPPSCSRSFSVRSDSLKLEFSTSSPQHARLSVTRHSSLVTSILVSAMLVYIINSTVIMACRFLLKGELALAEYTEIELTFRCSTADFRCNSYGIRLTINPVPSESGTSFSGFLIFMCSAWKFPSIMKPLIKRVLLQASISSYTCQCL
jgi:hypothetical protein